MATNKNKSESSKKQKEEKEVQLENNADVKKQAEVKKKTNTKKQATTKKQTSTKKQSTGKKQTETKKNTTAKKKVATDKKTTEKKQTSSKETEVKKATTKTQTTKKKTDTNKKTTTTKKKKEDIKKVEKEENKEETVAEIIEEKTEKEASENIEEKKEQELKEIKELIKPENKEIIKQEEKPEFVKELIKKRKKVKRLIITGIISVLFLIIFSTIFAILNTNNSKIINGISVKNIDISNLSKEDAVDKLTDGLNKELIAEIDLSYGNDYSVTLKPEQIEFIYDITAAVEEAYNKGRTGNILIDNYTIIFATLFGKEFKLNYSYNGELLNQFVEDIRSKLPGIVVEPSYYIENDKLFVTKGTDGIEVKKDELKNQIIVSIIERNLSEMTDGFKEKIEIPAESVEASEIDMKKIKEEIYREPQNAYFETDPYKIYPDLDGIDFAISVEEAQNQINQEDKEEYSFNLKITEAEITVDELGKEAFPYLISSFSTKYDASNRNRSTNLKIAAEKINGKVLMPGEEFSFNKIVGKRTVEAGYKDAAIYADGGVVDGLAGGICQISSTLYNSVLLANLQITERRNHSFTTSYAPAGRDATVVWGTTDFRFINSRSYPIKIEATVNNGVAEFKLYGMQEEVEYEVRILPVRTQSIPYKTTYEEDPSLIPGQQIIKQSGHSGCKVTTYKELRLNGEVVSKEPISNDTYQPMRTIIRVAPGNIPQ